MWLQLIIMNIPSSPLKENLRAFFQDCEKLLENSDLQDFREYEVKYKYTRQIGLFKECKPQIKWVSVRKHFEEKVKNLESINPCVDNLIEYLGLIYNKGNKSGRKWDLIYYFFEYKQLQTEFNLSIADYIEFLIKGSCSESLYFKTAAQLIEFKTNLEQIKIHNFTIRMPTDEELNRIINDHEKQNIHKISNPNDIAPVSLNSVLQSTQFWIFTETQRTRLKNPHVHNLYQGSELNKNVGNSEIIKDFKRLILALRLYSGNYIGIRSIFINESFVYESTYFEPWIEYPFLNSDFGHFHNVSYSLDLESKEIQLDDVERINNIYQNLLLYEQNPLGQIGCALDHYFKAFEQTYPVYVFTELVMSFETLLHKNDTDIHMATKKLKQLVPRDKRKNLENFFHNEKDGCYEMRNKLLHGDINLDFEEIRKKIPGLEEYVRLALLRMIELRIDNELNCNENDYFEKLDETLKIVGRRQAKHSL